MAYPVLVRMEPALADRNRLTTAFRCILAIPHLFVVGSIGGQGGLIGSAASFLSIVSWFTILIAGTHIDGIRQFTLFYLRWRTRVLAYYALLLDTYPPFGDAPYPTGIDVAEPAGERDRLSVGLRLFLIIPHAFVLFFLVIGWWFGTIAAWFMILATGTYPAGLAQFSVGVLRWSLRVEAYMLLLTDEYPPFTLEE
jgi:hypothetical protein